MRPLTAEILARVQVYPLAEVERTLDGLGQHTLALFRILCPHNLCVLVNRLVLIVVVAKGLLFLGQGGRINVGNGSAELG